MEISCCARVRGQGSRLRLQAFDKHERYGTYSHASTIKISSGSFYPTCQLQFPSCLFHLMIHTSCLLSRTSEVEPKYYADGEDAFAMKKDLSDLLKKVSE